MVSEVLIKEHVRATHSTSETATDVNRANWLIKAAI